MAIFIKDGQRKDVADHLEDRIKVLIKAGWKIEEQPEDIAEKPQAPKVAKKPAKDTKTEGADAAL